MFRLSLLLCLVLFAALAILPSDDPAGTNQDEVGSSENAGNPVQTRSLTLSNGEVWTIDRVIEPADGDTAEEPGQDLDAPASDLIDAAVSQALGQEAVAQSELGEGTILYVTGDRVNLRDGPSTDNAIVAALLLGSQTVLLSQAEDGWLQIQVSQTGQVGFMSGDFLSTTAP